MCGVASRAFPMPALEGSSPRGCSATHTHTHCQCIVHGRASRICRAATPREVTKGALADESPLQASSEAVALTGPRNLQDGSMKKGVRV
jgi:hypothetical protein